MATQALRDTGQRYAATERSLARLYSRRAYMQGRGEGLGDINREIQSVEAKISARQQRLGTGYDAAIQAAPRDYNRARGLGSREYLESKRIGQATKAGQKIDFSKTRYTKLATIESGGKEYTGKVTNNQFVGVRTVSQQERAGRDGVRKAAREVSGFAQPTTNNVFVSRAGRDYTPVDARASFTPKETGRPRFTSAYGASTPTGMLEIFPQRESRQGARYSARIPTFKEKRARDIQRLNIATNKGDSRGAATAFFQPFVTTGGLAVQKGALAVERSRFGQATKTTPIRFVTQGLQGVGSYARLQPNEFLGDINKTFALGALGGYGSGKLLQGIGSGKLGGWLAGKAGTKASTYAGRLTGGTGLGLPSRWGVGSVRAAETTRLVGGGVLAVGAGADIVTTYKRGGAKAIGQKLPAYAAGFVGFSKGFSSSGVQVPQVRLTGKARTKTAAKLLLGTSQTRAVMSTSGTTGLRLTAYGGSRTIQGDINTFSYGSRLAGTSRFEGKTTYTSTARFGGRTYKSVAREPTFFDLGKGTSGVYNLQGQEIGVSVAGKTNLARVFGSQNNKAVIRDVQTFGLQDNKITSYSRGMFTSTEYGTPLLRVRAGGQPRTVFEPTTSKPNQLLRRGQQPYDIELSPVKFLQESSISRFGFQGISEGRAATVPRPIQSWIGSRGKLGQGVRSLGERGAGRDVGASFRGLFGEPTPPRFSEGTLLYSTPLGVPLGVRGRLQPPRVRSVKRLQGITKPLKPRIAPPPQVPRIISQSTPTRAFFGVGGGKSTLIGVQALESTQISGAKPRITPQNLFRTTPTSKISPRYTTDIIPRLTTTTTPRITTTIIPRLTTTPPPPTPPTTTGGDPIGFTGFIPLIPPLAAGGSRPTTIGGTRRGFRYKQDLISSVFKIKGKKKKGALAGFELRPLQ